MSYTHLDMESQGQLTCTPGDRDSDTRDLYSHTADCSNIYWSLFYTRLYL